MSYVEAVILGAIQGITEFIPISSSGHLIAIREVLAVDASAALVFDVLVHVATLAALVVYFYRDIAVLTREAVWWLSGREHDAATRRLFIALLVGTLPAAVVGFFFQDIIEGVIRTPMVVVFALLAGSAVFALAEYGPTRNREITVGRGALIGFFQVLALIPGMSRAGITIAGGLFGGLSRTMAARFSFLLGIPIIAGAGLKTALSIESLAVITLPMVLGAVVAFFVGIASIALLLRFLRAHTLNIFIVYRIVVALLLFVYLVV